MGVQKSDINSIKELKRYVSKVRHKVIMEFKNYYAILSILKDIENDIMNIQSSPVIL